MTRIVTTHTVDAAGLQHIQTPFDDLVLEERVLEERDGAEGSFQAVDGPFHDYERQLSVKPLGGEQWEVTQALQYRLAIPIWKVLFAPLVRRRFKRLMVSGAATSNGASSGPWWAPPDRFDARAATVVSFLAVLAIVSGYLGSLLSQTLSFAGREFGADSSSQSYTAGLIRLGTPLAFAVMWVADRRGRRQLLLGSSLIACVLAALTALAPGFWAYALVQSVFRALSTAMSLLIGIVAVEESPAGSRAFVVSLLSLCGGLGAGMVVWAVPLAGLGTGGWRWIFVLSLIGLIPILAMWRRIPETARFEAVTAQDRKDDGVDRSVMKKRLAMLAATAFLFTLFAAPASTLNTDYLQTVHDFSPNRVSLFKLVTSTPIGLGVLVAGWIADRKGRKAIGAFGVATGAILTVVEYNSAGAVLWVSAVVGTVLGGAVVPTLGVYGPELFGTVRRGTTNGLISMFGVAGSITGLFLGGWLISRGGYGQTFSLLVIGPLIVAGLVLFVFPETAQRSLEDINPEDQPLFE